VIFASDLLYFGNWDILAEDTRGPLLKTLVDLCGKESEVYIAWVVRHPERELRFLHDAQEHFRTEVEIWHTGSEVRGPEKFRRSDTLAEGTALLSCWRLKDPG